MAAVLQGTPIQVCSTSCPIWRRPRNRSASLRKWRGAWPLHVAISIGVALLLLILWKSPKSVLFFRTVTLGLAAATVFSLFEVWPRQLPRGRERWILQVVAVGAAMPLALFVMHRQATSPGAPPFFEDHDWLLVGSAALLVAPWTAVATVVRQKEAFARNQKLSFALERSELERQALDARLHLLQAQVAPHFLFNTLANVQALVDAGSPHPRRRVLRSLTAYLRAAVPLLHEPAATIERELQLVRPYLELMQMRMPDRLQYAMNVDPAAWRFAVLRPQLLTLVENAVRHGIDPSEEGGRIDIDIDRHGGAVSFVSPIPAPDSIHRRTVSAPASRRCASGCS